MLVGKEQPKLLYRLPAFTNCLVVTPIYALLGPDVSIIGVRRPPPLKEIHNLLKTISETLINQ